MLIRDAELTGETEGVDPVRADVRLERGRVAQIAQRIAARDGEPRIEARGGALLPGLHDHHIHLMSLAASLESLRCGPPDVRDRAALEAAIRGAAARTRAVRGVGYHESVAGPLDRDRLDALLPDRPLRIQHRSGALWILNSAAIAQLGENADEAPPGASRDARGRLDGRFFRLDRWLAQALPPAMPPSLDAVGRRLARFGVIGATDATPGNDAQAMAVFERAVESGALPLRLLVMGDRTLPARRGEVASGALKILLDDDALPEFDTLCGAITEAHAQRRPVAFHCVTRTQLVYALSALEAAGTLEGDRIEHAAIAPPDLLPLLRGRGVTVVTQPNFIRERGDVYAVDVAERERPWLYRCRGFSEAGIPLAAGTDAPFGEPDPWRAMAAAVDRRSETGRVLGEAEGVSPERALALFTTRAEAPGGPPRRVEEGAVADLCLLHLPWSRARDALDADLVRATYRAGQPTAGAED